MVRGTSQNPDTFFQAREAINPFYDACAGHVIDAMNTFAELLALHEARQLELEPNTAE